jgi:starvation-inducible DNA-binding protein
VSAPDLDLASVLEHTLTDLLNLGILAKQVHWNIVGPGFPVLHSLLDDVAALARDASDRIAERSMALGRHPDGRTETVAMNNPLPVPDLGPVRDTAVIVMFGTAFETVSTRLFARLAAAACDPVTQALLTDIAGDLEKFAWMIRAQGL